MWYNSTEIHKRWSTELYTKDWRWHRLQKRWSKRRDTRRYLKTRSMRTRRDVMRVCSSGEWHEMWADETHRHQEEGHLERSLNYLCLFHLFSGEKAALLLTLTQIGTLLRKVKERDQWGDELRLRWDGLEDEIGTDRQSYVMRRGRGWGSERHRGNERMWIMARWGGRDGTITENGTFNYQNVITWED